MKDLLFVIGRIRALEGQLVTRGQLERMVDAPTTEEAFRVMTELSYGEYVSADSSAKNHPELIDKALDGARKLISNGALFPQMKLLWLKYDLANLKAALRYRRAGKDLPAFTRSNGFEPLGDLDQEILEKVLVKGQRSEAISQSMTEAAQKALQTEKDTDSDLILTQAYFAALKALAKKAKTRFVSRYLKQHIDTENLRSISRSFLTLNRPLTKKEFVEGGSFDFAAIKTLKSFEELQRHFYGSAYEKLFTDLESDNPADTMAALELRLMKQYYDFLTHEESGEIDSLPIPLAYFEKFLHQSNLIRYIFTAKMSGISNALIKERITHLALS